METNNANEHNMVKNPNWQETDQLAIYKRGRGVELGSIKKQLQLSGQSGTRTRDLRIQSLVPCPLGYVVSLYNASVWQTMEYPPSQLYFPCIQVTLGICEPI